MPLVPAIGGRAGLISEFKDRLINIVNSGQGYVERRETLFQTNKK